MIALLPTADGVLFQICIALLLFWILTIAIDNGEKLLVDFNAFPSTKTPIFP